VVRVAAYEIYYGYEPVLWLKAMGARGVTVPGPTSSEHFKPFRNPMQFESVLPVLWREDGNTIYGVPSRSRSLAHVVPRSALAPSRPAGGPIEGTDLKVYVDALEDPVNALAELSWASRRSGRIRATVAAGDAISVQVNYHPGWRATVQGRELPIRPDG